MTMSDATCARCRKRYGWRGEPRDMPPCPRCGHKPDPAAIAADQAEIDELRAMLRRPRCERCAGTGAVQTDKGPRLCRDCQGSGHQKEAR